MTTTEFAGYGTGPDAVLARFTSVRRTAPHHTLHVTAELHSLKGQEPHFSVTAEDRYNRHHVQACGCMHEEVLRYWPKLAPVVRVHLSDRHGVPMHAVANALYHAGIGKYSSRNPQHLASHLRIGYQHAVEVIVEMESYETFEEAQEAMEAFVEAQRPRWQAEADEAIEALGGLL